MKCLRMLMAASCFAWAAASYAQTNPAAAIYDRAELEPLQPRYQRGWLGNYTDVFRPVMTNEERTRLDNVQFRVELSLPSQEPFGFAAAGDTVLVSTASLKFLDDLSVATAWLDLSGFTTQTVSDYLLMLRYWGRNQGAARPPRPLEALCIPDTALNDRRIEQRALRLFDGTAAFALLHEYGHAFRHHPGNLGVPAEVSRANEEAADQFGLDLLARVNEAPLGLSLLFLAMSQFYENRADFATEAEYHQALASRTHPVSPERLQRVARHIAGSGRGFTGNSRATALKVSLDISQLAVQLADLDVQRLAARIGRTVTPADLAPRRRGRQLAPPCRAPAPTGLPFDGTFRGSVTVGQTSLDVDAVLTQTGDRVTGSYSFGAGFARLKGTAAGTDLSYAWELPPDSGFGTMQLRNGAFAGSWGMGRAASGAGTVRLGRER